MKKLILLVSIAILSHSCISVKVESTHAPKVDYSKYKTFCWMQGCEQNYDGPDFGYDVKKLQMLQDVIKQELEAKGLVNDENDPDILIGFHVNLKEQKAFEPQQKGAQTIKEQYIEMMNPYNKKIKYWEGYENYYRGIYKYLEGSLIINLVDSETSSVIFQTTAKRFMELDPKINRETMEKSVAKAMKKYPAL